MTMITLKRSNREQFILLTLCGLMLLTISKDLLHSFIKDYRFYLSESMLFGMFWLFFVPFALVHKNLLNRSNQVAYLALPLLFSVLHIFIFSLLVYFISSLFFNHTFGIGSVLSETFADNGLSCLLIYGSLAFIFHIIKRSTIESGKNPIKIRVTHQNKIVLLAYEDIFYLKTERPYVALVTQGKTYLKNTTLKSFKDNNLPNNFIQIHKSTIINMSYVASYKSRKNGDYDVFMLNGDTLRVSRNFNIYFKSFSKVSG